jgi:aryl-alcohol dehydrogenase-like predicted oxidoreductase
MMIRKLGRSGIEVSAIALGCLSIGGPWTHHGQYFHNGEVDDATSIQAIHRAL